MVGVTRQSNHHIRLNNYFSFQNKKKFSGTKKITLLEQLKIILE